MWAIIIKDLYQVRKSWGGYFISLILLGMIFLFIFRNADYSGMLPGLYWAVFTGLSSLFMQLMKVERKNKGFLFLRSLPIAPKDIVKAKFLEFFLAFLGALLMVAAISGILVITDFLAFNYVVLALYVSVWVFLIYISVYMVNIFCLSQKNARVFYFSFLLSLALLVGVIIQNNLHLPSFSQIQGFLWSLAPVPFVLYLGVMFLSMWVFKKPGYLER